MPLVAEKENGKKDKDKTKNFLGIVIPGLKVLVVQLDHRLSIWL